MLGHGTADPGSDRLEPIVPAVLAEENPEPFGNCSVADFRIFDELDQVPCILLALAAERIADLTLTLPVPFLAEAEEEDVQKTREYRDDPFV